jgi:DNA-binding response OmpR family regulator
MTAGLKLAETCGFDAVLSDIGLPDGNGYQLIRALRRRWPNVPAVAFTAWCSEQDRKDALDAGFNQHLCKPVDIESLRAALSPEQATHSSPAV